MNSSAFAALVEMQLGAADAAARSYEVGLIQNIPVPELRTDVGVLGAAHSKNCVRLRRDLDRVNEVSHVFSLPALLQSAGTTLSIRTARWQAWVADVERQLAGQQHDIDEIAYRLYGITNEDRTSIEQGFCEPACLVTGAEPNTDDLDEERESIAPANTRQLAVDVLSYTIGCALGRWDVRFATGVKQFPPLPDPFAPMPVCPPSMLIGPGGLPLHESPPDYPLAVAWPGILVDDPEHPDDIVRRVRDVLHLIWGERAGDIEAEACQFLGVRDLRDYFRKPGAGGFWTDHVRRYSKSRRNAPIYWLLQSGKKSYALYLYYHRLDRDLLYKALRNYVEPRLRLEAAKFDQLRTQRAGAGDTGRAARQLGRDIERQEALLTELHDFPDALRRAADLGLAPNLNDGIVLNIAPLWEVVPWREAKAYWDDLLAGEYEWSSIGKQLREKGIVKG